MSQEYQYDPPDNPIVGGYAAQFGAWERNMGRSAAKAATARVLRSEPYEPTGDLAFDTRAAAFRAALLAGEDAAFEESSDGFLLVGLYWQGTYGDPLSTERFRNPPTNSQGNYEPSGLTLLGSPELQEWMAKDFNYAAWLWVKDTDPYTARRAYVTMADKLLKKIPGDHLQVMDSWPKYEKAKSPPPPGGRYPNRSWEKANAPRPPKASQAEIAPVVQEGVEGPTLREPVAPMITAGEEKLSLPATEDKQPLLLEAPEAQVVEPAINPPVAAENMVAEVVGDAIVPETSSPSAQGSLMIEAAPEGLQVEQVDTAKSDVVGVAADSSISAEAESSVDLTDVFAGIKGIRPDAPAIGEPPAAASKSIQSAGGVVKHFAVMAGIGAAVGSAIGLGVIALKQFNVWPFNRGRRSPQGRQAAAGDATGESSNNGTTSKNRRRHARAWDQETEFLVIH